MQIEVSIMLDDGKAWVACICLLGSVLVDIATSTSWGIYGANNVYRNVTGIEPVFKPN
jgi:hypothetical protein